MRKIKNPSAEIALPGFEVFHEEFLTSRKEELIALRAATAGKDFKALTQMAHKWKGFCDPYGFQELAQQAIKLDIAAQNANSSLCAELLDQIGAYLGED